MLVGVQILAGASNGSPPFIGRRSRPLHWWPRPEEQLDLSGRDWKEAIAGLRSLASIKRDSRRHRHGVEQDAIEGRLPKDFNAAPIAGAEIAFTGKRGSCTTL